MEKFSQMLEAFNKRNQFEIDGKAIVAGVKDAMRYEGKMRDDRIWKVLNDTFPKIANEYEELRCQRNTFSIHNWGNERYSGTCNESQFLTGYIDIIAACAQEMDPNYRPEFMLGMNKNQSKEMLEKMFASYTHREDLRDNINNYEDIRQAIEDIDFLKYQQGTNTLRVYDDEPKEIQGNFRDLYMHKEVMKDELKQRNIFWRWFSRDAWAMRKYIKVAEQTLKSAQFPRSAENLAKEELNGPAVREDYRKQAAGSIDKHFEKHAARYEEIRNKQKLLTVRFHPEQSNLKSYLKAAEELGELLNADKGNLAPEVKEVFNLNREKLSRLEKAAEIRKNGAQMQFGFAEGSFVQMEIEFEKKHPDFKNISFEDVEKECLKEKVSVNDSLSESNQEIKPKEAEPTVVKEDPVKSV
jgi:hypothetical protein